MFEQMQRSAIVNARARFTLPNPSLKLRAIRPNLQTLKKMPAPPAGEETNNRYAKLNLSAVK